MSLYYTISVILLILPSINFAVSAPLLVREKPQARIGAKVVQWNAPEGAIRMLGKRGNELNELWLKLFGHPESYFLPPELYELSAEHPSSNPSDLPPSGPADMPMDVEQLQQYIPEEPPQVSRPDRAPPSGPSLGEEWNKMWRNPIESHFTANPEKSSAARPSLSAQPLGPAGRPMGIERPLPSVNEEQLPVPSQDNVPSRQLTGGLGDEWTKMWRNLQVIEPKFPANPKMLSAARPSSNSQPLGDAGGPTDVEKPLPPINEEPLPVPSQGNVPSRKLTGGLGDEWTKMWRNLQVIEPKFPANPKMLSAARPSSNSQPLGHAGGPTDVEKPLSPINEEPLPVPGQDNVPSRQLTGGLGDGWTKMWRNLIETNFPANPEMSSAARPSSSSQPLGHAGGPKDVEKPLSSIDEEPFPVSSQDHVPLRPHSGGLGDEWTEMWRNLIETNFPAELDPPAARPPSGSQPPWHIDAPANVVQPLPSIPKELPQVAGLGNVPQSQGDGLDEQHLKLFGNSEDYLFTKLQGSSVVHPSSGLPLSEPAGGTMNVEQLSPSIHEEPSPVSSPGHVPQSQSDGLNELYLKLFGQSEDEPEVPSAARLLSPSSPTDGPMDVGQPSSSIHEKPSPVFSPDHVPPSQGVGLNELYFDLFGHTEDDLSTEHEGPSATRPSPPSIHEEPLPMSSPDRDHVPPSQGSRRWVGRAVS